MSRRTPALVLAVSVSMLASASATAAVPQTFGFSARLVDEATGEPVHGTFPLVFALFDAETDGEVLWEESREVTVDDGVMFTEVGASTPLELAIFDGRALWLEIEFGGVTMEPRIALGSVPYAFRSATADAVGGIAAADVQQRISGTCSPGNYITAITAEGTVKCAPDLFNLGDITSVVAGPGLQGGGPSGDLLLSLLQTCELNQVLKWDGETWVCANDIDTNDGGDITDVIAGNGLTGGGETGAVTLQVGAGQGISVEADSVGLDTAFTDARYLKRSGGSMTGNLEAGGFRILNRGCPSGFVRAGANSSLCVQDSEVSQHTFSSCANYCNNHGAHMCSSAEMLAVLQSDASLSSPPLLNWIDDQVGYESALYVASTTTLSLAPSDTSTSRWCRCCASVE